MTGIARTTVNALESNRRFLAAEYALLIRDALKCALDDLYEAKTPDAIRRGGAR